MATVTTLITGACRLLGRVGEGETPSSAMLSDALAVLNDLIDSLNTERLFIPQIQDESFSLASGTQSKTIGVGGNFNTTRPVKIESAFVRDGSNVDYQIDILNEAQYANLSTKSLSGSYPEFLYYEPAYPLGTIWLYPLLNQTLTLHLTTWKQLAAFATVGDTFALAPGYARMFRYALALELAPEFGVDPPAIVVKTAAKSLRNIKRMNAPNDVLSVPVALFPRGGQYNINTDS